MLAAAVCIALSARFCNIFPGDEPLPEWVQGLRHPLVTRYAVLSLMAHVLCAALRIRITVVVDMGFSTPAIDFFTSKCTRVSLPVRPPFGGNGS
jgi:hypothetical protein